MSIEKDKEMNDAEILDEWALLSIGDDSDIEIVEAALDFNPDHGSNSPDEMEI